MTEFRYRAYLSYSHKDEAWASWLHRALESYRVPRNLVGNQTSVGEVPARIRPVFRDRDDLSSATDLEGTVKQALADSENLIVICSPDAAASRWVREEIRYFGGLGRADRIFCIIVDGEPAADGSVSSCFSAALAEFGLQEPLAADVRKWADGKHVAKLKLIAGLLGLRLDELRQRELQRRHKRQVVAALGMLAALILALMTVLSQISEQHEREKAEQLATFIVDLGERLQSEADLEVRALISEQASRYLESLNPDKLSAQTGKNVALAFRQMGLVSQGQGRPDEALQAFKRSRDIFSTLVSKYPEVSDLLFQQGNAEYYIGVLHHGQGRVDGALEGMQNYHRLTRTLFDSDPENPDWIMELAYSHNNLAAVHLDNGMDFDDATQAHVAEAVRLAEMASELKPEDQLVADGLTTILAWAADAQRLHGCNLQNAMFLRKRVTELRKASSQADPGNNDLKKRYAYDLSGLGRLQIQLGMLDSAEQNLEIAVSELRQLSAADPSNVAYREDVLSRQFWLAKLIGENGRLDEAKLMMRELEPKLRAGRESVNKDTTASDKYIDLLIAFADIESRLGETEVANSYLQLAMQLQLDKADPQSWDNFDKQRILQARYQWWEQNGEEGLDFFTVPQDAGNESTDEFRSCSAVEIAARMYALEGDNASAATEVKYLVERGYVEPGFMRFCEQNGLRWD